MKLQLIEDGEWKRCYKLSDGRKITIQLDESFEWIKVWDGQGREIGRIEFDHIEYDPPLDDEYRITWMYMDIVDASYKRNGIGRACLQFFNEYCGKPTFSPNDGIRRDDGSHLTQDAPVFIRQMKREGLIAGSSEDC